jgi:hypothetical protein
MSKNPARFLKKIFYIICCTSSLLYAEDRKGAPIYISNQNPFIQIFGLPKAEPGWITSKGKLNVGFSYYASNNAIIHNSPNGDAIIWDGETAQYTLRLRYGLFEKLEIGADLSLVDHSGGYLDSLIRHTHDILGMPNDRQEQFGKNKIHYKIDHNGTTIYETQERDTGLGDIRLFAAVPLLPVTEESERYLALRSLLKLPTGNADTLLGSGGVDFSLTLAYSDYKLLQGINSVFSANIGTIYMGDSDVLHSMQNNVAIYGGTSIAWLVSNYVELKLQLDLHSDICDTDIPQLGSSIQLLAGGTIHLPGNVALDLGMSQQLVTDATPDVGFYLILQHLF